MSKLDGKIAIITGGSSGIGLAAAKKFVEEGAYVFIMGRRQGELDKAKAEIGRNVSTVQGDVANLDDLDRLYKTVKEEKGAVDIVVASAAFAISTRHIVWVGSRGSRTWIISGSGPNAARSPPALTMSAR